MRIGLGINKFGQSNYCQIRAISKLGEITVRMTSQGVGGSEHIIEHMMEVRGKEMYLV